MNDLREKWHNALSDIDKTMQEKWWGVVEKAYTEAQRHYHTLQHLQDMTHLLDSVPSSCIKDKNTLLLATFFHDIVYDPQSSDNEEKSASMFKSFAGECSLSPGLTQRVSELILQTKTHLTDDADSDGLHFLDADMAVLGKPREEYDHYAKNIRLEYQHLSEESYRTGRSRVLKEFLTRDQLFRTPYFQSRFEQTAKDNMERELRELEQGSGQTWQSAS